MIYTTKKRAENSKMRLSRARKPCFFCRKQNKKIFLKKVLTNTQKGTIIKLNSKEKNENRKRLTYRQDGEKEARKMFKKFIERLIAAETEEQVNHILYDFETGVDMAYQRDKITYKEHELLFELAGRISVTK